MPDGRVMRKELRDVVGKQAGWMWLGGGAIALLPSLGAIALCPGAQGWTLGLSVLSGLLLAVGMIAPSLLWLRQFRPQWFSRRGCTLGAWVAGFLLVPQALGLVAGAALAVHYGDAFQGAIALSDGLSAGAIALQIGLTGLGAIASGSLWGTLWFLWLFQGFQAVTLPGLAEMPSSAEIWWIGGFLGLAVLGAIAGGILSEELSSLLVERWLS